MWRTGREGRKDGKRKKGKEVLGDKSTPEKRFTQPTLVGWNPRRSFIFLDKEPDRLNMTRASKQLHSYVR